MNHKAAENPEQQDAGLTNLTISIIQRQERFEYIPEFNRHLAMHSQHALDLVLKPIPTKVARNTFQTRIFVRIASNVYALSCLHTFTHSKSDACNLDPLKIRC